MERKTYACALAIALFLNAQQSAESKPNQPAVFLKEHSQMYDDVDFLVTEKGFSMTIRKTRMALYMQAPLWHITYANLNEKVYFTCPPDKWKGSPAVFSALVRPSSPTSLRLTTSKKTKYKGLDCTLYKMETQEASRGTDRTWKKLLPKDGQIWVLQQKNYPLQTYQAIANLLALPPSPGIPVAMTYFRFDGVPVQELSLYGFEKRLVSDADLAPPQGFKKVSDQMAVFNKNVESKDFAEFLDEKRTTR